MKKIDKRLVLLWLAQALLFALLQTVEPEEKLEFSPLHLLHLGLWLGWVRARKPWSQWYRPWIASLAFSQLLFLVAHYYLRGSASLVYLAGGALPLIVWGLVRFARWNWACLHDGGAVRALGISAVSWGLMAAAYPPLPLGAGGLVFLAPWFLVLWRAPMRSALFASFWSGFLFNALSYYWIYNVVKVGPGPAIMAGLFLLISYFSLYILFAGWAFVKARELKLKGLPLLLLAYPIFWAGLEVTRTCGDFSFPWSPLGMIFADQVAWLQGLAWIGVFGYSALVVASNLAVAYAIRHRRWWVLGTPLLVLGGLWGQGAWVLSKPEAAPFYQAAGTDSLDVALVQPSIHQTKKWSRAYYDTVMEKTWSVVENSDVEGLQLMVWPETAVPDVLRMRTREQARIKAYLDGKGFPLFLGALHYERKRTPGRRLNYYNSGFLFGPEGARSLYHKIHLVPFSERLPFDDVFPLLNYVDFGEGDFSPGDTLPVLQPGGWTPMICYEAIYGDMMRQAVRNGARLIVNITNDGWFGRSTAPYQHLNLVRYRAIENGIPVARCANSGVSAFIDARGHIAQSTELFTEAVIRRSMPLGTIPTLYGRIGALVENGLLLLLGFWLLLLWLMARRKRR